MALAWQDPISLGYMVFTYSKFMQLLEDILTSLALPTKDFASHSFRWGRVVWGASFTFRSGVHVELIKILGD